MNSVRQAARGIGIPSSLMPKTAASTDRNKLYRQRLRGWIVERTIAWLNRCRRLSKDWECLNRNALAFLRWASIRLMLRRLCHV